MTTRAVEPMFGWTPMQHSRPKLTPAQREQIAYRRGDGDSLTTLARKYGVSTAVIGSIAIRERT